MPPTTTSSPELVVGDCCKIMREWAREAPALIFADPPFNIGRSYDICDDRLPKLEYENFTREWLDLACGLLKPGGALWVNIPDEWAGYIQYTLTRLTPMVMRNWCIWHYRFGQNTRGRFISSKVHALYFVKPGAPWVWNEEAVLEPSDRASKYKDKRTHNKKEGADGMRVPLDVWYGEGFSRITGNNRERRALHDNQLPEAYLHRVISATSNPGDLVFDPFSGSGTSAVVAHALGRRFVGCDLSETYVESAKARVKMGPVLEELRAGLPAGAPHAEGVAGQRIDHHEAGGPA